MKLTSATLCIHLFVVAGCSKQEPTTSATPPTPPKQTMPALQPGGEAAAPAAQPAAAAPAPPAAIDLAAMKRPVNDKGDPMSDLEMLNQLVANYNEARATLTPARTRTYKTEAEQMAAEAQSNAAKEPVKDLSELVKAGVIKALPTPPAGKKFAIDPQTHKVVLVNAP